jgi:hypothetical protein
MTDSLFVLRGLPGVAELEARLERIEAHPSPLWAPEADGLGDAVDLLSMRLFGISNADTDYQPDANLSAEAVCRAWDSWEQNFALIDAWTDAEVEAAGIVWRALGWDCKDAHGNEMLSVVHLGRQMVCAAKGLCGHLPGAPKSDHQIAAEAAAWEQSMLKDAERFRRARRG